MKNPTSLILNSLGFVLITAACVYGIQQVLASAPAQTGQDGHGQEPAHVSVPTTAPASNGEAHDSNRLWCEEHGVYEDECVICHPEIANAKPAAQSEPPPRDPNRLWCREHGVYEDECVICHPEIANAKPAAQSETAPRDPNRLWCREHGVYEDECFICHPELANNRPEPGSSGAVQAAAVGGGLFCNTHGVPERQCAICQPQLAQTLAPGQGMMVRLPSAASDLLAGVRTGRPRLGMVQPDEMLLCEVAFNQNAYAHVSPLAGGTVTRVFADLGDRVEQGETLAEIASNEIAKAKSEYLKALDQERLKKRVYEREKELLEKRITAEQDYLEAEAGHNAARAESQMARRQLLNYGLTAADIEKLVRTRENTAIVKVRAPFSGTIVGKHAVPGEAAGAGEPVFQLADLSTMWLELSIPESMIQHVSEGAAVAAAFEALPGETFEGEITWVSPMVDRESRMLRARAEVPNPRGLLKQGLYGSARPPRREAVRQTVAPLGAVQQIDGQPFVFVMAEDDLYEARRVRLGRRDEFEVEIAEGLSPEDPIVIANSFVLKSEFLKSRFGAGCADH